MSKFKPNPRAKAPFACSFSATGKGYVLCERWSNRDGKAAETIHYDSKERGPAVSALTPRERREWDQATKEEWG